MDFTLYQKKERKSNGLYSCYWVDNLCLVFQVFVVLYKFAFIYEIIRIKMTIYFPI